MVLVTAGKDRGKTGKVLAVDAPKSRLTVEGVNFLKKHVRPNPNVRQAGIVERPGPLSVSNVKLLCTKCSKATRVAHEILEVGVGDLVTKQKVRVGKQCHQHID